MNDGQNLIVTYKATESSLSHLLGGQISKLQQKVFRFKYPEAYIDFHASQRFRNDHQKHCCKII